MKIDHVQIMRLMKTYLCLGYELTLLEVHKLLYFLQISGEPLGLHFSKGKYGPFAENIASVLGQLEGRYISGYDSKSNKPDMPISLTQVDEENVDIQSTDEAIARASRVEELIEGFESPYGMELLSTVYWQCSQNQGADKNINEVIEEVHRWDERKKKMMKPKHIKIAWKRLKDRRFIK